MVQTTQDFNAKFYSGKKMEASFRNATVLTGQGTLAIYTALMLNSAGKYVKADTNATPANTTEEGWAILLEEVDTSGGDVVAKIGVTGEIDEDDVVMAGTDVTTVTEIVKVLFGMNNIFINQRSNSIVTV